MTFYLYFILSCGGFGSVHTGIMASGSKESTLDPIDLGSVRSNSAAGRSAHNKQNLKKQNLNPGVKRA